METERRIDWRSPWDVLLKTREALDFNREIKIMKDIDRAVP